MATATHKLLHSSPFPALLWDFFTAKPHSWCGCEPRSGLCEASFNHPCKSSSFYRQVSKFPRRANIYIYISTCYLQTEVVKWVPSNFTTFAHQVIEQITGSLSESDFPHWFFRSEAGWESAKRPSPDPGQEPSAWDLIAESRGCCSGRKCEDRS